MADYRFNFELAEPLTQQEAVVLSIGLQVSDTLPLSIAGSDAVTFFKTASGSGTTVQASFAEDLLMAPGGSALGESVIVGIGLVITDSLTLVDRIFYVKAQRSAGGNSGSVVSIGDGGNPLLKETVTPVLQLQLSFSDNLNYWLDQQSPPIIPEWDLIIICPHLNNWLDQQVDFIVTPNQISKSDLMTMSDAFAFSMVQEIDEILSDTMTLSDGIAVGYGDAVSDQIVLSDQSPTITGEYDLVIVCPEFSALWLDSAATALANPISKVFSDSLSMSDALGVGYGEGMVEQLSFSDASGLGFGFVISDTLTLSDASVVVLGLVKLFSDSLTLSDSLAIGYGNALTDSLTLSDALAIGYGNVFTDTVVLSDFQSLGFGLLTVDSLTLSDSLIVGYGDLITDTLTLSDAFSSFLNQPGLTETLSDFLTMADALLLGYGDSIADQLTLNEQLGVGYGNATSDSLTLSDSVASLLGLAEVLSDTLSLSDSLLVGYGLQPTDTLTMSEALLVSYGNLISDQLTISDQLFVGYGDIINDSLTLSDAVVPVLGLLETLSDVLSLSDSLLLGYGLQTTDSLTLSDTLVVGQGNQITDSLSLSDTLVVGYGDLIIEQLVLSDAVSPVLSGSTITEALSDSLTLSDALAIGYGSKVTDQIVLADQSPTIVGEWDINIICPHLNNWQDSSNLTKDIVKTFSDQMAMSDFFKSIPPQLGALIDLLVMSDQLTGIGYGNLIAETLSLSDQVSFILAGGVIGQLLSDTLSLTEFVQILVTIPVFADQMVLTDAMAFTLANATILQETPSDTLTQSDRLRLGYGNVIANQMSLSDAVTTFLSVSNLPELLSDSISLLEKLGIGYGLQITDLATGNVQQVQDSFSRPNENPLNSAVWSVPDSKNAFQLVSNRCVLNNPLATPSAGLYTGISWPNDQYVEVTIAQALANTELDVILRCDSPESNFYEFGWTSNGTQLSPFIAKVVAGVKTVLWTGSAISFTAGDVFRATAFGIDLAFYQNGTLLKALEDSSVLFGTAGFQMSATGSTTDIQASNFAGGQVVGIKEQLGIGYGLLPVELQIRTVQQALDTFTRPNENPLNPAAWTQEPLESPLQIVSNKCLPTTVGGNGSGEQYTGIVWSDDQYVEVVLGSSATGGSFDIRLRAGEDLGTGFPFGYDFGFVDNGDGTCQAAIILLLANGSATNLWSTSNLPFNDGDTFRAVVIGETLAFYQNGLLVGWINDTTFTHGVVGLFEQVVTAVTDIQLSSFVGGTPVSLLAEQVVLGFGNLMVDSLSLSDSLVVGYGNALSDLMVMSDNVLLNTLALNLVETLSQADVIGLGYGNVISDQMVLTDAINFLYPLASTLADTLTQTDSLLVGYGNVIIEQLSLSDQTRIGYADLLTDQMTLLDSLSFQLLGGAIGVTLSDFLTFTDFDFVAMGFGFLPSDQLPFVDSVILGYGNLLTDQLTLTDSMSFSFLLTETLADTLTLSDNLKVQYGLSVSDQLTQTDSLLIGIGELITEQLVLVDAPQMNVGLIITDSTTLSDKVVVGRGVAVSDQITQTDQMNMVEGLVVLLSDATPTQLDALAGFFTYALQVQDTLLLKEQLVTMWGILVGTESLTMADQMSPSLQALLVLSLSDQNTSNLVEAVIASLVFAPLEITLHTLSVFPEVIAGLQVLSQMELSSLTVEPELEEETEVG